MTECMDVLIYIMGSVQMLAGFYFLTRFCRKKSGFICTDCLQYWDLL